MPAGEPTVMTRTPRATARPVTLQLLAHVGAGGIVLGEGAGVHGALLGVESTLAPLSEGATVALATGLALAGKRVVVELVDTAGLARAGDALADLANLSARSDRAFVPTVVIRVPGGTDTRAVDVPVYIAGRPSDAAEQLAATLERGGVCVLVDDSERDPGPDGVAPAPLGQPVTLKAGTTLTVLASGSDLRAALIAAESAAAAGVDAAVVEVRGTGSLGAAIQRTGRVVAIGETALLPALRDAFWSLEAPWLVVPSGATSGAILEAIHQVAGA